MTQSRRAFLTSLVAGAALPLFGASDPIIISSVIDADVDQQFRLGLDFGAAEAAHTAKLMRRTFRLESGRGGSIVITIGRGAHAEAVAGSGRPTLAVIVDGAPVAKAYRLNPTHAERLAAVRRIAPDDLNARGVAWHWTLQRYGAGELNERFLKATGKAMDETAWLGWLAVKIALEASLRKRDLAAVRVDGHKGVALRFGSTRALEQPLYVLTRREGKDVVLA